MNPYNKLREEQLAKEKEKEAKKNSLERQLKMWKSRQEELRGVYNTALDQAFVRRQLDKCSNEITRINQILSTI